MPKSSSFGCAIAVLVARDQHVVRLEVAVDDACAVRGLDRVADATEQLERLS